MKFTRLRKIFGQPYFNVSLIVSVLLAVGLSTVGHYGISTDEKVEINMVKWNYELITTGEPIPGNLKYYGAVFNVVAEVAYQAKKVFDHRILKKGEGYQSDQGKFYKRIEVKHYFTFLASLIAYASVAGIVGVLAGPRYAWLGPLTLALFPRFWGHSFFNPKDIPFASVFALGIFGGGCLVNYYLQAQQNNNIKLGINRTTLYSLLYGILVGLATGVRVGGLFLIPFVIFSHLGVTVTTVGFKGIYQYFLSFWKLYLLVLVSWMTTTIIIHPASWSSPVTWLFETLTYLSKHSWSGAVLFEGQYISAQSLPWYYLPKWLIITTPVFFQFMFLIGIILFLLKYMKVAASKKTFIMLLLLQIFFLPTLGILKQATIYDGIRHFLFVLPGIASVSAVALAWIYEIVPKQLSRLTALVAMPLGAIVSLLVVVDMVALHPYEYVYFNRMFGGLKEAYGQYETDYWGLSMREGMEWINSNSNAGTRVVSSSHLDSSKTFADPNIDVIPYENEKRDIVDYQDACEPLYYIARPRWDLQNKFPECKVVYRVLRQNVPLTIVKQCSAAAKKR